MKPYALIELRAGSGFGAGNGFWGGPAQGPWHYLYRAKIEDLRAEAPKIRPRAFTPRGCLAQ